MAIALGSGTTKVSNGGSFNNVAGNFLVIAVFFQEGGPITGVTYNGVSLTEADSYYADPSERNLWIGTLASPATGSRVVSVGYTGTPTYSQIYVTSYTGVGLAGHKTSGGNVGATPLGTTLNENAGSWTAMLCDVVNSVLEEDSSYTIRSFGSFNESGYGDTDGPSSGGNTTLNFTSSNEPETGRAVAVELIATGAADVYLRSTDGNDSNSGLTPDQPKATLAGAVAIMAGGVIARCLISDLHSQAASGVIMTGGAANSPRRYVCIDDWGSETNPVNVDKTPGSGATFTTNSNGTQTFEGWIGVYGCTFSTNGTGDIGSNTGGNRSCSFFNCTFMPGGNGGSPGTGTVFGQWGTLGAAQQFRFFDCTLIDANVAQHSTHRTELRWYGGSFCATGTVPTVLWDDQGGGRVIIVAADCRQFVTGKTLRAQSVGQQAQWHFLDCGLGSGGVPSSDPGGNDAWASFVTSVNTGSVAGADRIDRRSRQALEDGESTVVRSGGAFGSQAIARRVVTSATRCSAVFEYSSLWMEIRNELTGSPLTVSVPIITDGVTLTDTEIWLEVEYLGTSGATLGSRITDRGADPYAAGTAQDTDSVSSWGGSLSSPVKQVLSVTITPQRRGLIRGRICVAKPNTTVYYDPRLKVAA